LTYESIAETQEKIAENESGEKSLATRDLAKNFYQKTLDILLRHEAKNTLPEYDREFLENTKKSLQRFE
jgi:hypothetical protein